MIGAGHRGRGWAALALSRGWPVSLYDPESALLQKAWNEVGDRIRRLTDLGRADPLVAAGAVATMRVGRSLLHAVGDADWVLDVMPLDLPAKQRLLEQIEQVAPQSAITVSHTSTMSASALCGRLRRPGHFLVAYSMDPVELIPLVEVIPGPLTDPFCTVKVQRWLDSLDRRTVLLKREVPGTATMRIAAAVWRECIGLVLDGVMELEDVDRLVSLGPALAWAVGGPYLSQVMNAGSRGPGIFMNEMLQVHEELWGKLASWRHLSTEDRQRLIKMVERTYAGEPAEMRQQRDRFIARLLDAMERSQGAAAPLEAEEFPPLADSEPVR
ncbi:MAG TPA: 3-hydroxyacyl-CoA dehydrogenase NAD-binding domain-containing protein [Gemmatimonadales bacterium]|nr:3-hydroxyacyl-CoA dehydrogenase NAD-binding domain-containing protein [Gemmatimonadales bacterium]